MASQPSREPPPSRPPAVQESAPSQMREDEPGFARAIGMAGLAALFLGVAILVFNKISPRFLGPGWGGFLAGRRGGHAAVSRRRDADVTDPPTYGGGGSLADRLAAVVSLLPYQGAMGSLFLPLACPVSPRLMLLLPFGRVEDDPNWTADHTPVRSRPPGRPWRRSAWLAEASRSSPAQLRLILALLASSTCGLPSVSSARRGPRLPARPTDRPGRGGRRSGSRSAVRSSRRCSTPVRALDTRRPVTSCPAACC